MKKGSPKFPQTQVSFSTFTLSILNSLAVLGFLFSALPVIVKAQFCLDPPTQGQEFAWFKNASVRVNISPAFTFSSARQFAILLIIGRMLLFLT